MSITFQINSKITQREIISVGGKAQGDISHILELLSYLNYFPCLENIPDGPGAPGCGWRI